GGSPTAADRILASRLGCHAILALLDGQRNIMIGIQNSEIVHIPLNKAIQNKKDIDGDKWNALHMLSI
ncbi:MAG: 6-phosphofructokinase, partial [Bacteroidales bacterium]|nr:6-phosphofructokinase [Candidatus Colicola faecequi]